MVDAASTIEQELIVNSAFRQFIEDEVLPLTTITSDQLWQGVRQIIEEFTAENNSLLEKRQQLQQKINDWHQSNNYRTTDSADYKNFLKDIGYLVDEEEDFTIETANVDDEIAIMAGPQLVVPLKNARFALNAVNARWGSLYDAIYSSDIIPKTGKLKEYETYNPLRGGEVVRLGREFLDDHFPLAGAASHNDVTLYQIYYQNFIAVLKDGTYVGLSDSKQFVAYNGSKNSPHEIILKNNGLQINLCIAPTSTIGALDVAGIEDIRIESALTTIMDCEDSVAAVDSEDKIEVYRNWLGLMTGTLSTCFIKEGRTVMRSLKRDRIFTGRDGDAYYIRRRGLMFIRNVGHLMSIDTIKDAQGNTIPEGILDSIFTALIGSIDLKNTDKRISNSKTNSIYIVKPKMHGPEEVAFTCRLFSKIEQLLDMPEHTIKLGIMDEERRTSINLKACIREAKNRCVFINTGFLDRTGDEIHTSMAAGPFLPKEDIKYQSWITAYENRNVDIGLACGLSGRAQIGKGMWPKPDAMSDMMASKKAHPLSGANTSWVPSPTAATLHAIHYHQVDVFAEQVSIHNREKIHLDEMLKLPLLDKTLSTEEIERELENNIQGILGYVVRWINQGIGCSKVPDINNIALMEDRATLRISSQHIANWLHHGICTAEQVSAILYRMTTIVDKQNIHDPTYIPMGPKPEESFAFQAARDLIFLGKNQPNGYTEPLLHQYRIEAKKLLNQSL